MEFKYYQRGDDKETPVVSCVIVDECVVDWGPGYLGTPFMDEIDMITGTNSQVC